MEYIENDESKNETRSIRVKELLKHWDKLIALAALIVSCYSLSQSSFSHKELTQTEIIRETYNRFHEIHKTQLENWQLSHMYAISDQYDLVVSQVATSISGQDSITKAKLKLKERAVAILFFAHFEETFYQWNLAIKDGEEERALFIEEILKYFTTRLLRNPRLLFYWSKKGGRLGSYFEMETKKYYDKNVLNNLNEPLEKLMDIDGPFIRVSEKTKNDEK